MSKTQVEEFSKSEPDIINWDNILDFVSEVEGRALGFVFSYQVCAFCGSEHLSFFAIPTKFPMECPQCGKMFCYLREEE